MAVEEKITDEQAEVALQQLAGTADREEEGEPQVVQAGPDPSADESGAPVAAPAEDAAVAAAPAEDAASEVVDESGAPPLEEAAPALQDVEKRFGEQMAGVKQRYAENERILRDRYLRKSTAGDKLVSMLEAAQGEAGVSPEDARRVIDEYRGTMHPASAGYAPPQPQSVPQQTATDDQAMTVNAFLNEQGMTQGEAKEFGDWITNDAPNTMSQAEQDVARESLGGYLRLAHVHWQSGVKAQESQTKRDNAVGAVRGVQVTQRAAARAAAPQATAPRTQPAAPQAAIDVKKLTESDVSMLLKQSVEQYR